MTIRMLSLAFVTLLGAACVTDIEDGENVDSAELDAKGGKKCGDPSKIYVSHDPDTCATIHFFCETGYEPFFNKCGCGCQPAATTGEPCNQATCGVGEFCCNFSCSICAPDGGVCTQQFCAPTQ